MKLSRKWLSKFVDVSLDTMGDREFAEIMTMSGSKVEGTEDLGAEIKDIVVGKIVEMEPHPDSDHMWICMVDVGGERLLQIVTGAQNQKVGDMVPVALDGAMLPGGKPINTTVFRGVLSEGMCCSLKELGLTLHDFPYGYEDGLFVLQEDCAPGDDISPIIGKDDHVVEFEITPNRSDCLSMIGMARETAVTFGKELRLHDPVVKGAGGNAADLVSVRIDNPELCPRYTARMVKNVRIAPSPKWMRQRIAASGMRPINNIVDITNYVMLEYGQPMHAFDFACVDGGKIIVRTAREGEVMKTLDGNDRKLTTSMLCICDEQKPVGVAGVMGGANSEIEGDTAMVLFEAATFNGTSIRRTAAALNMRTDASARFEKGLDPTMTLKAVNRACELVELLGAGEVVEGVVDVFAAPQEPLKITLDAKRVNYILGTEIPEETMRRILTALGFGLDGSVITVPSWRRDISPTHYHNDVAEEVARIYGFDNIPSTLMNGASTTQGGFNAEQMAERTMGAVCRSAGYDEVITYSFYSPCVYDMIGLPSNSQLRNAVTILNPLGEDTSNMRTTLLPSMLEVLTRNYNLRNKNVKLYEIGRTYFARADGLADEPKTLCMGAFGSDMDFYRLKGTIDSILSELRIFDAEFSAVRDNPSYHPGRCAEVKAGGVRLGVFGQVHPKVAENYGMSELMYAAELGFDAMFGARAPEPLYKPLPRFPAVTRDIALVCDDTITVGELGECIKKSGGQYLNSCKVFDVYKGASIPAGKKSVAFSLTLRADDQTLTDEHANEAISDILKALQDMFGVVIR
ncbi:MAG: phenylalanine--tRNA ligase subunit beta [Clostridia bacterium]|nr:phenylalanine--tRNA ligase subunit beta [Clostridia bacterium]